MDVILGTAGHIDHGKTALVRALTGIDCDRLEEERRRGITIELGFAWMDLPDGRRMGIVDVPGHERFIKNMAAGASGVDFTLMVIAADEGVMPQTREHLDICSLLGARSGLVALTKTDLADAEWLEFIREDVKSALKGSFLEGAPVLPVSSVTGEGLEKLRGEIIRLASSVQPRPDCGILRLPVDRVFSMKGFGTVATGTLVSGSCALGEKLCVMPSGRETRARNLQSHNESVESVRRGRRCAVNLQGLEAGEVQRGDVIARPGELFPSPSWLVRVSCLESSPLPIRQRMEAHFHHGASECLARIILMDRDQLEPGESCLATVKFPRPLTAVYGDNFVIRAHSPLRSIGGGVVINPLPPLLKKRDPDYERKIALLRELAAADKDRPASLAPKSPARLAGLCLSLLPAPGADLNVLRVLTGLPLETLRPALAELEEAGEAFCWDSAGGGWIGKAALDQCLAKCQARAKEVHERDALKAYFAPSALLAGWGESLPKKFAQEVLDLAVRRNILRQEGTGLKLARHEVQLSGEDARILEIILKKIKGGGAAPPFIREIAEAGGWEARRLNPILNYLRDSGRIVKIQDGVYYTKEEFAKIMEKIQAWFAKHEELDVGAMKEILGVSRKYAIPILEYLDSIRMTFREDGVRRLRKN